ncbi:hypothetical protein KSC_058860 [Ktedonobacter sp. SOSP1-52]|nr:hypothetical protein KSC_058860 [Ktedonobacter sp. SOSP1-52]
MPKKNMDLMFSHSGNDVTVVQHLQCNTANHNQQANSSTFLFKNVEKKQFFI